MKFEMNNCKWKIIEVSQKEIKQEMRRRHDIGIEGEPANDGRYFGTTYTDDQIIRLDEDLPQDRKKNTLIHELTHCYISSFITHMEKTYVEEDICDIVANSYEIISDIVNAYFH